MKKKLLLYMIYLTIRAYPASYKEYFSSFFKAPFTNNIFNDYFGQTDKNPILSNTTIIPTSYFSAIAKAPFSNKSFGTKEKAIAAGGALSVALYFALKKKETKPLSDKMDTMMNKVDKPIDVTEYYLHNLFDSLLGKWTNENAKKNYLQRALEHSYYYPFNNKIDSNNGHASLAQIKKENGPEIERLLKQHLELENENIKIKQNTDIDKNPTFLALDKFGTIMEEIDDYIFEKMRGILDFLKIKAKRHSDYDIKRKIWIYNHLKNIYSNINSALLHKKKLSQELKNLKNKKEKTKEENIKFVTASLALKKTEKYLIDEKNELVKKEYPIDFIENVNSYKVADQDTFYFLKIIKFVEKSLTWGEPLSEEKFYTKHIMPTIKDKEAFKKVIKTVEEAVRIIEKKEEYLRRELTGERFREELHAEIKKIYSAFKTSGEYTPRGIIAFLLDSMDAITEKYVILTNKSIDHTGITTQIREKKLFDKYTKMKNKLSKTKNSILQNKSKLKNKNAEIISFQKAYTAIEDLKKNCLNKLFENLMSHKKTLHYDDKTLKNYREMLLLSFKNYQLECRAFSIKRKIMRQKKKIVENNDRIKNIDEDIFQTFLNSLLHKAIQLKDNFDVAKIHATWKESPQDALLLTKNKIYEEVQKVLLAHKQNSLNTQSFFDLNNYVQEVRTMLNTISSEQEKTTNINNYRKNQNTTVFKMISEAIKNALTMHEIIKYIQKSIPLKKTFVEYSKHLQSTLLKYKEQKKIANFNLVRDEQDLKIKTTNENQDEIRYINNFFRIQFILFQSKILEKEVGSAENRIKYALTLSLEALKYRIRLATSPEREDKMKEFFKKKINEKEISEVQYTEIIKKYKEQKNDILTNTKIISDICNEAINKNIKGSFPLASINLSDALNTMTTFLKDKKDLILGIFFYQGLSSDVKINFFTHYLPSLYTPFSTQAKYPIKNHPEFDTVKKFLLNKEERHIKEEADLLNYWNNEQSGAKDLGMKKKQEDLTINPIHKSVSNSNLILNIAKDFFDEISRALYG